MEGLLMQFSSRRLQRGVSLIEALVSFGVMAFGMMAVVGMQATLRTNGDLARQRAEAVRIAQDAIEEWRGFTTLVSTTGRTAYADIVTQADATITPPNGNATYTLRRTVSAATSASGTVAPARRQLTVDVEWADRRGQTQSVRLVTTIAGVEPELSASLVLGSAPEQALQPRGRHRAIPPSAVPFGIGRSAYMPPGQTSTTRVAWVFNNTTGVLQFCETTATSTAGITLGTIAISGNTQCTGGNALLVSGTVRFATTGNPANSTTSMADPTGPGFNNFDLIIEQTAGANPNTEIDCYLQPLVDQQVLYECAVPITADVPRWSGYFRFDDFDIASDLSEDDNDEYKICRYHAGDAYTNITSALLNQNFVIIKAGDGSGTAYTCPTDTSFNPRTWAHQPTT